PRGKNPRVWQEQMPIIRSFDFQPVVNALQSQIGLVIEETFRNRTSGGLDRAGDFNELSAEKIRAEQARRDNRNRTKRGLPIRSALDGTDIESGQSAPRSFVVPHVHALRRRFGKPA